MRFEIHLGEIIRYVLKGFFLGSALAVLISRYGPGNSQLLVRYGKVSQLNNSKISEKSERMNKNLWNRVITILANWTVPKSWFTHFYVLSTILWTLTIWGFITLEGQNLLVRYIRFTDYSMGLEGFSKLNFIGPSSNNNELAAPDVSNWDPLQVWTVSIFFMMQSLRRCYETMFVNKYSPRSRMLLGHYLVGMTFYIADCLAIWTDGSRIILNESSSSHGLIHIFYSSITTYKLAWLLFIAASISQSWSHAYLASLRKYTTPTKGLFKYVACPHYSSEIIIYLACYSVWPTEIMSCMMIWVVCNLGISAEQSQLFYKSKPSNKRPKYALMPFIW